MSSGFHRLLRGSFLGHTKDFKYFIIIENRKHMTRQLITPNPRIECTPGMCLVYVRETFSIGPKHPSATTGWNASVRKHKDYHFPSDAWVPVWFSLSDNPNGHVALRQPDGSIWSASSPVSTMPVHHTSLEDIQSYYGGRLTYLGWTEDIEGVPVIDLVTIARGRTKRLGFAPPETKADPLPKPNQVGKVLRHED